MKTILQLANEHMIERKGCKISRTKGDVYRKDVKCIMCGRKMTTTKDENEPYYCYKCDDQCEGVFGLG